jgi:hypothetical protein
VIARGAKVANTDESNPMAELTRDQRTQGPIDPAGAASRLDRLGFLLDHQDHDGATDSDLLVAIRSRPTLDHFDPEVVHFWISRVGRGARAVVDRTTALPLTTEFTWGVIQIVDRLGVSNEYLTFGGNLWAETVDEASVLVFRSPAPLLSRGGHSQTWDRGADSLAAFFARLLIRIDFEPGFEGRVSGASPLVRYAAFVQDTVTRYRHSERLRDEEPSLWTLLVAEEHRLMSEAPIAWAAGHQLLEAAGPPTG